MSHRSVFTIAVCLKTAETHINTSHIAYTNKSCHINKNESCNTHQKRSHVRHIQRCMSHRSIYLLAFGLKTAETQGYLERGFVKKNVVSALGSPPLCGVNVKVSAYIKKKSCVQKSGGCIFKKRKIVRNVVSVLGSPPFCQCQSECIFVSVKVSVYIYIYMYSVNVKVSVRIDLQI